MSFEYYRGEARRLRDRREATRRVFEERATHEFPPTFVMSPDWRPELEALARELGFPLTASAAIEQRFLEFIQMLERSANPDE